MRPSKLVVATAIVSSFGAAAIPINGILTDDASRQIGDSCKHPSIWPENDLEKGRVGYGYDDDDFYNRPNLDHVDCKQIIFNYPQTTGAGDIDDFNEMLMEDLRAQEQARLRMEEIEHDMNARIVPVFQKTSQESLAKRTWLQSRQIFQSILCLLPERYQHYMICNKFPATEDINATTTTSLLFL